MPAGYKEFNQAFVLTPFPMTRSSDSCDFLTFSDTKTPRQIDTHRIEREDF